MFNVDASPLIVMLPEPVVIALVPVTAVPPQPISTPKWLPVPVDAFEVAPSISTSPDVVVIAAVFSISIPELWLVLPIVGLS